MNLKEAAISVGKPKDFFRIMEHNNIEKFKYIEALGNGNIAKGFKAMEANFVDNINTIHDAINTIFEGRAASFARWCVKQGFYKNIKSCTFQWNQTYRSFDDWPIRHEFYLKTKKMVKALSELEEMAS